MAEQNKTTVTIDQLRLESVKIVDDPQAIKALIEQINNDYNEIEGDDRQKQKLLGILQDDYDKATNYEKTHTLHYKSGDVDVAVTCKFKRDEEKNRWYLAEKDNKIPYSYISEVYKLVQGALQDDNLPPARLTPVEGKKPMLNDWQNPEIALNRTTISGCDPTGLGFCLDGNYIALDCDDDNAINWVKDNIDSFELDTVTVSSGKKTKGNKERFTLLYHFTDEQKQLLLDNNLKPKTCHPIVEAPNLEFLSGAKQFVIDGFHPETGEYKRINDFDEYSVKPCPDDVFECFVEGLKSKVPTKNKNKSKKQKSSNGNTSKLDATIKTAFAELGVSELYDLISADCNCAEYGEWTNHGKEHLAGIDPKTGKGTTGTSFQININPDSDNYGSWYSHKNAEGGGILQFIMYITDKSMKDAIKYLNSLLHDKGIETNNTDKQPDDYYHDQSNFDSITFACKDWLVHNEYITCDGEFYQYTNCGYWKYVETAQIRTEISHFLSLCYVEQSTGDEDGKVECKYNYFSRSNTNKCLETALDYLNYKNHLPNNQHLICFLNGTYDIKLGQLKEHRKDDYLFSQIPYNYDPDDCNPQQFLAFLEGAIGTEQIKYVQAFIQTLLDRTAPYGKFLHLIGESRCGKGTLLTLMGSLLNQKNVSSDIGLNLLNNPDKRHQYLLNKRFCYQTDMQGYFAGVQGFYSLVQNEALSGRKLHSSDTYTQKWDCRFAIASTDHLQIENSGAGWSRRVIPIEFNPRQGGKDLYLDSKLAEETAQIIAWALSLDPDERDIILHGDLTDVQRESINQQEILSDSVTSFIGDCLKPEPDANEENASIITNNDMWESYQAYCKVQGITKLKYNRFIVKLKRQLPTYVRERKTYKGGKLPQAFKGLYFANCFKQDDNYEIKCNLEFCFDSRFDEPDFIPDPQGSNSQLDPKNNKESQQEQLQPEDVTNVVEQQELPPEITEETKPPSEFEKADAMLRRCEKKGELDKVMDDCIGDLYDASLITKEQFFKLNDTYNKVRDALRPNKERKHK